MTESPRRYVFAHVDELVRQHEQGTTWADIARGLVAHGISITKDRLRVYISQARANSASSSEQSRPAKPNSCPICSIDSPEFRTLVERVAALLENRLAATLAQASTSLADRKASQPVSTAKSALFTVGLQHLDRLGISGTKARGLLGKWRKKVTDDLLLSILHEVSANGRRPDDPIALITSKVEAAAKQAIATNNSEEPTTLRHVRAFAEPASFGSRWTLLGWQHVDPNVPRDPDAVRLQIWRTPQGKVALIEPEPGTPIPPPEIDPGLTIVD